MCRTSMGMVVEGNESTGKEQETENKPPDRMGRFLMESTFNFRII